MRRGRPGPLPARSASTGPGRAQVASPGSRPSAKPSAMMRKTSSTLQCTPIRTPAMRPSANVARTAYSQLDRVGTANGGEDNPLLVDPDCTVRGFAPLLRVLVPSSSSTPVNRHRAVRHRSTRGTSQGHSALPGGAAASGAGCRAAAGCCPMGGTEGTAPERRRQASYTRTSGRSERPGRTARPGGRQALAELPRWSVCLGGEEGNVPELLVWTWDYVHPYPPPECSGPAGADRPGRPDTRGGGADRSPATAWGGVHQGPP